MPTVTLDRDHLYERLGKTYTQEEFELLCFEFGVELDDVTSAYQRAKDMNKNLTAKELEKYDQSVEYAIDVPANRYDLLCMEGMARALRIFLGLEKTPSFTLVEPAKRLKMTVESDSTDAIRPFCVCAVLRGVSFEDPRVYNSFIDLQDKLHQNICRRRTLVAIGTHDLDTLAPQFTYRAEPRDSIDFVPLTETEKSWTGRKLLDHYRTAPECKHLKPYTGIIYDAPNYPVIRDAKGTVLSLPPIINGRHSRIQPSTKNVFIECTATDETKANVVCSTVRSRRPAMIRNGPKSTKRPPTSSGDGDESRRWRKGARHPPHDAKPLAGCGHVRRVLRVSRRARRRRVREERFRYSSGDDSSLGSEDDDRAITRCERCRRVDGQRTDAGRRVRVGGEDATRAG